MSELTPAFALQGADGQPWSFQSERLSLQAVNNIRKLRLQVRTLAEFDSTRLERLLEIALPAGPQEKVANDPVAYWLGPNDWLLVNPAPDMDSINTTIRESADNATPALTDVTDAYSIIDISATDAVARLAAGCSVDFHDSEFPTGRYVLTRLQHLSVIIHRLDDTPNYRILVDRSVAQFLWGWLAG